MKNPIFRLSALMQRWFWVDKSHQHHLRGAKDDSQAAADFAYIVHLCISEDLV